MRKCAIKGCEGKPLGEGAPTGHPLKFLLKVVENPPEGCCVFWPFGVNSRGYGVVRHDGIMHLAHRIALILFLKADPLPGIHVAHAVECHNPACINPLHLRFATRKENMADKVPNGTVPLGERHKMAKLIEAEVIAIRADPRLLREIATDYGVSQKSIGNIRNRKTWKHI